MEEDVDVVGKSSLLEDEGYALIEKGDLSGALSRFRSASYLTPKNPKLSEAIAQILLTQGHTFSAIKEATKCIDMSPDFPGAYLTLARAQLNFGEIRMSISNFETALKIYDGQQDIQIEIIDELNEAKELLKQSEERKENMTINEDDEVERAFYNLKREGHVG
eukprot:CAMPEP_0174266638 /NCGR_PEP_ID=MMETSP0439-20130205/30944_1 /TAXON_ID=0 /ORGANISM="Stereomyxa ramosa, Strain Chinc5" /LENGTH=162 /DNA_ID=CAMNT_0015353725 /DNA_START=1 /DNA_END=489 /DNA_ORIENTATION=+